MSNLKTDHRRQRTYSAGVDILRVVKIEEAEEEEEEEEKILQKWNCPNGEVVAGIEKFQGKDLESFKSKSFSQKRQSGRLFSWKLEPPLASSILSHNDLDQRTWPAVTWPINTQQLPPTATEI